MLHYDVIDLTPWRTKKLRLPLQQEVCVVHDRKSNLGTTRRHERNQGQLAAESRAGASVSASDPGVDEHLPQSLSYNVPLSLLQSNDYRACNDF